MKNKERLTQIGIVCFLALSTLLTLLPVLYTVSLSFQSYEDIYGPTPKLIPSEGQHLQLRLDFDEDATEKEILDDSAMALFAGYYENRQADVERVEVFSLKGDDCVFHANIHFLALQQEFKFGIYKSYTLKRDGLLKDDQHLTVLNNIGYTYDENGIDVDTQLPDASNEVTQDLADEFEEKELLTASTVEVSTKPSNFMNKLENYKYYMSYPAYAFSGSEKIESLGFFAFMLNTLLTVGFAMICQIIIPAITAYALVTMFSKRMAKYIMNFFLITMMIPFVSIMVPQLVLMEDLGMFNNYGAMLFPWLLPSPFYIFLYKGFFSQIPKSYYEAAQIDGAGAWYSFIRICLPMSKPIIALIAIQSFISGWNDFFWYLLATRDTDLWTLNLAIFQLSSVVDTNFIMGLSVTVMIPIIAVAILFSRQIKQSVISSGVKE